VLLTRVKAKRFDDVKVTLLLPRSHSIFVIFFRLPRSSHTPSPTLVSPLFPPRSHPRD
jgi:hypothetical protein